MKIAKEDWQQSGTCFTIEKRVPDEAAYYKVYRIINGERIEVFGPAAINNGRILFASERKFEGEIELLAELTMSEFQQWFTAFIKEKKLDMSEYMGHHDVQAGDVCQKIMNCPKHEQDKILQTLVMIDFRNGDVYDYLRHLAKSISKKELAEMHSEMAEGLMGEHIRRKK